MSAHLISPRVALLSGQLKPTTSLLRSSCSSSWRLLFELVLTTFMENPPAIRAMACPAPHTT